MSQQIVDFNHQLSNCLVEKNYWGYLEITNICTEAVRIIPWSFFNYLATVMVFTIAAIVILACLSIVISIFRY